MYNKKYYDRQQEGVLKKNADYRVKNDKYNQINTNKYTLKTNLKVFVINPNDNTKYKLINGNVIFTDIYKTVENIYITLILDTTNLDQSIYKNYGDISINNFDEDVKKADKMDNINNLLTSAFKTKPSSGNKYLKLMSLDLLNNNLNKSPSPSRWTKFKNLFRRKSKTSGSYNLNNYHS